MAVCGTASSYRHDGCRCDDCRSAMRRAATVGLASRNIRRGREPQTRVAAVKVRAHVAELERQGLTRSEVARRAGVSPMTVSRIMSGPVSSRRCSIVSARRLLGVTTEP